MLQSISGARWVPGLAVSGPLRRHEDAVEAERQGPGQASDRERPVGEAAGVEDREPGDPAFQVEGDADQPAVRLGRRPGATARTHAPRG